MKEINEALQAAADRRQAFIEANTPEWIAEGAKFRTARDSAGLSIAALAKFSGWSESKLRNFENGEPGLHKTVVKQSYRMALTLRKAALGGAIAELED